MKRSYHFFIFLVMLALLVVSVGVVNKPAAAADPVYTCFPTCSTTDGKFLAISWNRPCHSGWRHPDHGNCRSCRSNFLRNRNFRWRYWWALGYRSNTNTYSPLMMIRWEMAVGIPMQFPQFSGAGLPDNDLVYIDNNHFDRELNLLVEITFIIFILIIQTHRTSSRK